MKLYKFIGLACILVALNSCKKENGVTEDIALPAEDNVTAPTATEGLNTTPELIADFIKRKSDVVAKLKTMSGDEASAIYETYKAENDSTLLKLEKAESNILENYYSYYTGETGEAKSPPDTVKQKEKLLTGAGLEFWEIGEGYVEIRTKPDFYFSIFKDYVTDDYREYLTLTADEDKVLYQADAGLAISFKDVGKRVLSWEKFIKTHPYSKLTPGILEMYKEYQNNYLLGMDNTPTAEHSTNEIYPENSVEFNSFIKSNPGSPTTPLVKIVLNYKGHTYALRTMIGKEQARLLKKMKEETTSDYY